MQGNVQLVDTVVYAGRLRDREALMKSSSGGAFTAISDVFLNRGDAIACSIYNYEDHAAVFRLITTKAERDEARGSKYMQSKPGNIFAECADWLKANPNKNLLFVGMGCQADGFRKYIEAVGLRDRTFIADIICHGSPSPKLWREYIRSLEKKHHGMASALTFKDKRNGWRNPTALVSINRREVSLKEYIQVFYNQCALRPSCHTCRYATTERKTDMTIGDFWHIEKTIPDFYDPIGNSLFLIHTDRGLELFEALKESLEYRLSDTKACWQKNLEHPTPVSAGRDAFWRNYQAHGIGYIMKKYGKVPFKKRIKNAVKRVIKGV